MGLFTEQRKEELKLFVEGESYIYAHGCWCQHPNCGCSDSEGDPDRCGCWADCTCSDQADCDAGTCRCLACCYMERVPPRFYPGGPA